MEGLLQFDIRAVMNPMESLEEKIVRAISSIEGRPKNCTTWNFNSS